LLGGELSAGGGVYISVAEEEGAAKGLKAGGRAILT